MDLHYKAISYIRNKWAHHLFLKSKKYVDSWGNKSYGEPHIVCYDLVSKLSVGKYVSISDRVSILLGANHKKGLITTYPRSLINKGVSQQQTNEPGSVIIGNDVWVGYGVTIIGPVSIGDGAIVGAGALVLSDVAPYSVVGGVPAKELKKRFNEDAIYDLQKVKWWDKTDEEIKNMEGDLYSSDPKVFIEKYLTREGESSK